MQQVGQRDVAFEDLGERIGHRTVGRAQVTCTVVQLTDGEDAVGWEGRDADGDQSAGAGGEDPAS